MRKYHQQQMLELLQIISEAQVEGRFEDCLDGAHSICEFVENTVGLSTRTVSLLKNYCELLQKENNDTAQSRGQLKTCLAQVAKCIITELKPNRIEIAFLSYKASMSDSLESIYLAAKSDPDCDAFWIPIPYYDRRPDFSFGEMHFEGADYYNDKFEVTDWREYDMEARRPDVIFTFNPYDQGNYVTSVHPDYYCERLRKLTDMLVYIPYFVSVDDVAEHFCTNAGCAYAHKVVLQSEKLRNFYIDSFKKQFGNRLDHILGTPEDRFIALGSPKFDKAINTKPENYTLPDEWEKLVENKKIVLYNTSLGSLLAGGEQYLGKLRSVLATFHKRKDVALWWRPHPLSLTTYSSMRPQLMKEYEQIVADYKRAAWGIYDETPDLHRAIARSDAYFGDWSSLVALYMCTGKDILIQRIDIEPVYPYPALPECSYVDGQVIWFTVYGTNGLYKMDRSNFQANLVCELPWQVNCRTFLYRFIEKIGEKLYLAPGAAQAIVVYDILANTIDTIEIDRTISMMNPIYSENIKFLKVFSHYEALFFVGCYYPAIIRLDTSTGKLEYFTDWVRKTPELTKDMLYPHLLAKPCVVGSIIHAPLFHTCAVLSFDMESCTYSINKLDSSAKGWAAICFDGSDCWLAPTNDAPILKWNPITGACEEYGDYPEEISHCELMFTDIAYCNGFIWLSPSRSNLMIKIDVHSGTMTSVRNFEPAYPYEALRTIHVFGDVIHAVPIFGDCIERYDANTNIWCKSPITLDRIGKVVPWDTPENMTSLIQSVPTERALFSLVPMIDALLNTDKMQDNTTDTRKNELLQQWIAASDGTAGYDIYSYIKREALRV